MSAAELALEAMRSRNRVDSGRAQPHRPRPPTPKPATVEPPLLVSEPIVAHHRGTCGICFKRIWEGNETEQGDEIVQVNGVWVHLFCAPEIEETSGPGLPD